MLHYSLVFFVIALVAALFGFGGIAAGAVEIAKILCFVFLAVTAITLILGLAGRADGTSHPGMPWPAHPHLPTIKKRP